MYQLANELRQQIYELTGREQESRYRADQLKFKHEWKQKQLDDLLEQIANIEQYEAEQRELALKI